MTSLFKTSLVTLSVIVCGCILASVASAQTGEVYSLNVVGFQKVNAPGASGSTKLQIAGTPFEAANDKLDSVIGPQLTGQDAPGSSDNVILFNPTNQQYETYFIAGGIGDPQYDGKWFTEDAQFASNALVPPGRGFWIRSRQAVTQTVVFAGDVVSASALTNRVYAGLQLLSYPYSTAILLNNTTFSNGAVGSDAPGASDNILLWNASNQSYVTYFIAGGIGDPQYDGKWFTEDAQPATNVYLQPGQGFWYRHRGSGFSWVEQKPYTLP